MLITQGKTNWKFLLIVVILAAIVGGGILWCATKQKVSPVPLSSIAEKIEQEQVESITIQGINVETVLKDGTHLYSKREAEIPFSETLLSYGVTAEKLRNVKIEIKEEKLLTIWFTPLLLFIIYLLFIILAPFFIIWGGLKIFNIQGISNFKVIVYIVIYIILYFLVEKVINPLLGLNIESNRSIYYFVDELIYLVFNFLLLKYYFQLSGKKLWQFFVYLIIASLIFSVLVSLPAILS